MQEQSSIKIATRVFRLTGPYRRLFWATAIVGIIIAPVAVMRPALIQIMVDDYIMVGKMEGMLLLAALTIGTIFLEGALRYFFSYYSKWLGQAIIRRLRLQVFSHVTRLHLSFFNRTAIGKLTTRTINDIETINKIFSEGIITIVSDILTMIVVVVMMLLTSWKLTLVVLTVFPILIYSTYVFKEKVRVAFEIVREKIAGMNAFVQERISGIHAIKVFGQEEEEAGKFKLINREYTQANIDTILYYAVFFPVVELISATSVGLLIWYGAKGVIAGHVTIGALISFPLYVNMLYRPVRMLADKFNALQMGIIVSRRVFGLLDVDEHIQDEGHLEPKDLTGDIVVDDLRFRYGEGPLILKNISLIFPSGKSTAIVGSTGSGKTTLISLLNRSYDYDEGHIRIGDIELKDIRLSALRQNIGVVLQDVFLFRGSILDNLTMKATDVSEEKVIAASKKIGAHSLFMRLPGGYDFEVMERGGNLSAGQRQLISFVRAIATDPDILILDEATSAIDPETESIIQHAIEKIVEKRTSIIIAHRLGTIKNADQIVVLEQGKIVEIGNHQALINKKDSHYANLYKLHLAKAEITP